MEPVPDISQTHPYTCNSCAVAFRNSDAQRTHMRSEWHRYNLKRRVASLPAISSDVFNEKVLAAQATTNNAAAKASFEKDCSACQKTYFSENAYQNHIGSQKHKLRVVTSRKDSRDGNGSLVSSAISQGESANVASPAATHDPEAEAEFEKVVEGMKSANLKEQSPVARRPSRPHHSAAEDREPHPLSPVSVRGALAQSEIQQEELPPSRCLFCNYDSPTFRLSISHMTKHHGLFIPEQNYLVDLEGLMQYFQAKIHQNHECLFCHKLKNTASAIQTHMRDKGHCMVAFETEEEMVEVGQFYDFSSTYSDTGPEDGSDTEMEDMDLSKSNGGVKLPKSSLLNSLEKRGNGGGDDGWETDSTSSSIPSEDIGAVPIDDRSEAYQRLRLHKHHSHTDPRPHKNPDGFHSHAHHHGAHAVYHDDDGLHLPSGRTAGHRSLRRYYRQNLHSYPTAAERLDRARLLLVHNPDEPEHEHSDAEMADKDDDEHEDVILPPPSPELTRRRLALSRRNEMGMVGATAAQKRQVLAAEKRDRKQGQRMRNTYQAKLEKQGNHQKHFRDPLLQ